MQVELHKNRKGRNVREPGSDEGNVTRGRRAQVTQQAYTCAKLSSSCVCVCVCVCVPVRVGHRPTPVLTHFAVKGVDVNFAQCQSASDLLRSRRSLGKHGGASLL